MCGIAGFVGIEEDKAQIIKKMTERIKHRGPDAEGFYIDEDVALGHRRLSIIDLDSGNQPIFNENKDLIIVFNGEIYNYLDLKKELGEYKFQTKSDTEVLIHAYEKWGKDVTSKLRGMFAFAIWDKRSKELFMARDPWGIKPLYYQFNNNTFMFASEIKAFLDHPNFKKELNEDILRAYLCFNSVPTTQSMFKDVYRVEPGQQLLFKDGKIEVSTYYELNFSENGEYGDLTQEIADAMEESVKYHEIADVEVGSFLSSGVDSSYLVSLAKPDKTYTVGYENPKYDETSHVKDLAQKLNIHNNSRIISREEYKNAVAKIVYHMDEPLADPSANALYFVSEIASKDVKVVLSGEGADEFFGGYQTYLEELDQTWYNKIPYFIRRPASFIAGILPPIRGLNFIYRRGLKLEDHNIGLGRVFRDDEALSILKNKKQIKTKEITKPFYDKYKNNSSMVKRQVIDYYFWLVRDFLHAVDRQTMIFGLEARTPYLDVKVQEIASKLKVSDKIEGRKTKMALREAAKRVIPNESYKKEKLGFPVPLREWIKEDDYYNDIKAEFNSEIGNKFFDVNKITKLLDEHKNNKKDNYKKVWAIYIFILWYKEFFS